jgi:hypothetical protein
MLLGLPAKVKLRFKSLKVAFAVFAIPCFFEIFPSLARGASDGVSKLATERGERSLAIQSGTGATNLGGNA